MREMCASNENVGIDQLIGREGVRVFHRMLIWLTPLVKPGEKVPATFRISRGRRHLQEMTMRALVCSCVRRLVSL